MGIHLNIAVELASWIRAHRAEGPLISLGVQDTPFTRGEFGAALGIEIDEPGRRMTAPELYGCWGVTDAKSLDVSGYEGADVIFDLNQPELPSDLRGAFGIVLNGGTLEHVFHVPNALTNMTRMLQDGGVVIHIMPMHNWVDHGFYQFSPTLLYDYYRDAAFEILEAAAFFYEPRETSAPWTVLPVAPGMFGMGLGGTLGKATGFIVFMARRGKNSCDAPIPTQSLYADPPPPYAPARWFPPFELLNGRKQAVAEIEIIELTSFVSNGGFAWVTKLPRYKRFGDSTRDEIRSPLILMEDTRQLGPGHSQHDRIRAFGRGAYSHWQSHLYLSSSDGTDPNNNGRRYTAILPRAPGDAA